MARRTFDRRLIQLSAAINTVVIRWCLLRKVQRRSGLFLAEAWREILYVCNKISPLLTREREPGRHGCRIDPSPDRVEQVYVEWNASRRRGTAFESADRKVARLWFQIGSIFTEPVP